MCGPPRTRAADGRLGAGTRQIALAVGCSPVTRRAAGCPETAAPEPTARPERSPETAAPTGRSLAVAAPADRSPEATARAEPSPEATTPPEATARPERSPETTLPAERSKAAGVASAEPRPPAAPPDPPHPSTAASGSSASASASARPKDGARSRRPRSLYAISNFRPTPRYLASVNTRTNPAVGPRTTSRAAPHVPEHLTQHGSPRAPHAAQRLGINSSISLFSTRTVSRPAPTVSAPQPSLTRVKKISPDKTGPRPSSCGCAGATPRRAPRPSRDRSCPPPRSAGWGPPSRRGPSGSGCCC